MDAIVATRKVMFDHIDIFSIIYPYLCTKDQLNLLLVSKNIYWSSKGFRYLRLNESGSKLFEENELFRVRMLSLVTNTNRQIKLTINSVVFDINTLGTVHTLTLSDCQGIVDVGALGTVHILTLINCQGIVDVGALGTVHTLTLTGCHGIVDVEALGTVHTLTLTGCHDIVDVGALGTVHTLELFNCSGIVNVEH